MNSHFELDNVLWAQSGVNRKGEPFVQLLLNEKAICQFTVEEARGFANNIVQASEAAEQDAFLLDFFQHTLGTSEEHASKVLIEFRKYREQRGKKGPPSDPNEFMVTPEHKKPI